MPKIVVMHASYGCETGCCGHIIKVGDDERFTFAHPYYDEDYKIFAERVLKDMLGEEHVADLAWDECVILED